MKPSFFFKISILAALYLLLKSDSCYYVDPNPTGSCASDNLTGTWVSDYFEVNGLPTDLYQMTLVFDDECQCTQTLKKPGNLTISETLSYEKSTEGKTLTIGSAEIAIEKWEWADELVLRYVSGGQPAGFPNSWKATMRLQ